MVVKVAKLGHFLAPNFAHTSGLGSFFFSFPPDSSPEAIKADYFQKNPTFCSVFVATRAKNQSRTIKLGFVSTDVTCYFCPHALTRMRKTADALTSPPLTADVIQPFLLIKIHPLISVKIKIWMLTYTYLNVN
jgi:hypothetical protein